MVHNLTSTANYCQYHGTLLNHFISYSYTHEKVFIHVQVLLTMDFHTLADIQLYILHNPTLGNFMRVIKLQPILASVGRSDVVCYMGRFLL